MNRAFIVSPDMPRGVTVPEMQEYINSAVRVWKGQLFPEEPLYNLDRDSIHVTAVKQRRKVNDTRVFISHQVSPSGRWQPV